MDQLAIGPANKTLCVSFVQVIWKQEAVDSESEFFYAAQASMRDRRLRSQRCKPTLTLIHTAVSLHGVQQLVVDLQTEITRQQVIDRAGKVAGLLQHEAGNMPARCRVESGIEAQA